MNSAFIIMLLLTCMWHGPTLSTIVIHWSFCYML